MLRRVISILKSLLPRSKYYTPTHAEIISLPEGGNKEGCLLVYSADIDEELEGSSFIAYGNRVWRVYGYYPHINPDEGFYLVSILDPTSGV